MLELINVLTTATSGMVEVLNSSVRKLEKNTGLDEETMA